MNSADIIGRGVDVARLRALTILAQERSFTRAAVRLGLTASALSKTIRQLEAAVGVRLVNRTTRSMALTEAGHALVARVGPAIEELRAAIDDVASTAADPIGRVRLNMPLLAGELIFAPALARFAAAYPRVELEIVAEDGFTDIVAQGCDAGVRLGPTVQQDMVAVPVSAAQPTAIVASPAYLVRHGTPTHPDRLRDHACLNYRWSQSGALFQWPLSDQGEAIDVAHEGRFVMNDTGLIILAVLGGAGLAMILRERVASQLADGSLVSVLDRWCPDWPPYFLYYPGRRHTSPALLAVADFFRHRGDTDNPDGSGGRSLG